MQNDYTARLARLRAAALARGVDAVALVPGANLVYFTGLHFHLSERPTIAFVLTAGGIAFIVPKLEYTKLTSRLADLNITESFIWSDTDGYAGAFAAAAQTLNLAGAPLGIDDMTMRMFEGMALQAHAADVQLVGMGADLLNIRAIKAADEVEMMRRAVQLSEQALEETLAQVRVGMDERDIAALLSERLQANGAEGLSFSPLVLSGEKSALPHGTTGGRTVQDGEFLLFDFGGMAGSYPADITRTFVVGTPTEEMQRIYNTVQAANAAARAVIRPGVTCDAVDRAARDVIEAAGYGEFFTHRTGHGLGLEVHELPQIAAQVEQPLEAGMVFTVEPGIYVPNVGGVRIEDNIVVTADGCESLTTFARDLRSLKG